jgi:hypothetical protein
MKVLRALRIVGAIFVRLFIGFGVYGFCMVVLMLLGSLLCMWLDPTGRGLFEGPLKNERLEFGVMMWVFVGSYSAGLAALICALWRPFRTPWKDALKRSLQAALLAMIGALNVLLLAFVETGLNRGDDRLVIPMVVVIVVLGIAAAIITICWKTWWGQRSIETFPA